jgi:hypothetical protein
LNEIVRTLVLHEDASKKLADLSLVKLRGMIEINKLNYNFTTSGKEVVKIEDEDQYTANDLFNYQDDRQGTAQIYIRIPPFKIPSRYESRAEYTKVMTKLVETEFFVESLKEKKYFTADFYFDQNQQKAITKRIILEINGT